ncbi:MAG: NAD(P)/FAD-dependent oxidoreductase [Burkholderiaceae bacterium]|nr:NAD(P)/FAD-dependent oxidoreductase [Burkholderiaceae bacterium]
METVQTVVIGAGVVGLAIARELALAGREVVILERENAFGTVTSARNSEVLHAGIYYEPGSLKARLCVEGRGQLVEFCRDHGVAHRICGKLIVAAGEAETAGLERIERRARAAGVESLRWLGSDEARALEPALRCHRALLSPDTGIVDSHGLMLALLGEAEDHGAMLALLGEAVAGSVRADGFQLEVSGADGSMRLACRELVNAAGLGAQRLASRIDGLAPAQVPPLYLAKGNYFSLAGRSPFSRLIYPVPNEAGLGVHLTLDLGGQARFGPDVEWIGEIGYHADPHRADGFYAEIRSYWSELPDGVLLPSYSGVRPKLVGPGAPAADFRIDGASVHRAPGLVNLFGIESPGLTACLAIAARVRRELDAVR